MAQPDKKPRFTPEQQALYETIVKDVGQQLVGMIRPFLESFFQRRIIAPSEPPPRPLHAVPPQPSGGLPGQKVVVRRMCNDGSFRNEETSVPDLLAELCDHMRYLIHLEETRKRR